MIDVYYFPTPNGWKVTIFLEEAGLDYQCHKVDIRVGDQFLPAFLAICPNNKMPAIVDNKPKWGGEPVSIFESGAILEYLANKTGKFLPASGPGRYQVLQWVYWQMANLGPMAGNANHFRNHASYLADDPSQAIYGQHRFESELSRLCGVMEAQFKANAYLAGGEYSIADMAVWPWVKLMTQLFEDMLGAFPNLLRWAETLEKRPAVTTGYKKCAEWARKELTEPQKKRQSELLFNQSSTKLSALSSEFAEKQS